MKRAILFALVAVALLSLGGYGAYNHTQIIGGKIDSLKIQNAELRSELTNQTQAIGNEVNDLKIQNAELRSELNNLKQNIGLLKEKIAASDLDDRIYEIYERADYLAGLEVEVKTKNGKRFWQMIEEMNGKGYAMPGFQNSEKPNDTGTIYLCDSLFPDDEDDKYYILTAGHIRDDEYTITKIHATFKNGETAEFQLLGYDDALDAALLKPKNQDFHFSGRLPRFGNSGNLRVQQTVVHLGSPLGLPNVCSRGAINNLEIGSAYPGDFNKRRSQQHLIMHDAQIDSGSSGGPLLNLNGEMVGINIRVSQGYNAWSLSVPMDDIQAVMADLKNGVQR